MSRAASIALQERRRVTERPELFMLHDAGVAAAAAEMEGGVGGVKDGNNVCGLRLYYLHEISRRPRSPLPPPQ